MAMYDALESWFRGKAFKGMGFSGCAFINAAGEFGAQDHPAHRLAAEHKVRIVEYLERLCVDAGLADPGKVAERLALLKEGAIATAHVRGMPEAAQLAKEMARLLIEDSRAQG